MTVVGHDTCPSHSQRRTHPPFTLPTPSPHISYPVSDTHPSDVSLSRARKAFDKQPQAQQCASISRFIKEHYRAREANATVYLDYGGAGRPMQTVLRKEYQLLSSCTFGNPHSINASSVLSSEYAQLARNAALSFFNTTAAEHECVWTAGASSALTMFRNLYFDSVRQQGVKTRVIILDDVHNSVNGLRTVVQEDGLRHLVSLVFVPIDAVHLRVDEEIFRSEIDGLAPGERGLVLFTAQSNLSGVCHNLSLLKYAKRRGWHTLLDAACFVPTSVLDLAKHDYVEFVPVSWYKVVGHPTGLGSLIIRQSALSALQKSYFAGGTVISVSNDATDAYVLHPKGCTAFEDGTINFRSFPALSFGLSALLALPRPLISQRTKLLLSWLIAHLTPLRHMSTGHPLVRIVGFPLPDLEYLRKYHGSTISMVFYTAAGQKVPPGVSENLAVQAGLEIRSGCMCNTSARTANIGTRGWHGNSPDELARHDWVWSKHDAGGITPEISTAKASVKMPDGTWNLWRMPDEEVGDGSKISEYGVIRVSLGLPSSFDDVYAFYEFARRLSRDNTSGHREAARPNAQSTIPSSRPPLSSFVRLFDNVKLGRPASFGKRHSMSRYPFDNEQTLALSSSAGSFA